jgi:hypothetical protein
MIRNMKIEPSAAATDCSCSLWSTDPHFLESQGVPRGYCGHCDVCGAPGHLRHFPGAVPVSSVWCDRHYRRTLWLHPMGARGKWLWTAVVAVLVAVVLLFNLPKP